jgi:predicted nucleotidyltransferase
MRPVDPKIQKAISIFVALVERDHPVAQAYLFGSYARGDQRKDSDIDVAVILRGRPPGERDFWKTAHALSDVAYDVLVDTGVQISPLPIWEDQWKHPELARNPRLITCIERDGVLL